MSTNDDDDQAAISGSLSLRLNAFAILRIITIVAAMTFGVFTGYAISCQPHDTKE